MNDKLKILIAYDGSGSADASLDDLVKAGLPMENVEATVISVAEIWLPPQNSEDDEEQKFITESVRKRYEAGLKILEETKKFAKNATERVRSIFPNWEVKSETTYGSPAWEILSYAEKVEASLIVVGAKGLSAVERVLIGSISQKVVTEANCSVRVARGKVEVDESPTRIIVGYDGTDGSNEVIKQIAKRHWKSDTQFKIVIAEDTMFIRSSLQIEADELEKAGNEVVENLHNKGLQAFLVVEEGNPKQILIEQADKWDADCIFIGATQYNDFLTKYLLGSVSSAVVTRANCSVEVIRPEKSVDENE